MKPQARIQAVIEILSATHLSRVPLDAVVGDYMRARRYIGSKDRSYIAEHVYDIVRHHARLGWWLDTHTMQDTVRARALAYLILKEEADEKRVQGLFDGSKYAPEPLDNDEVTFIKSIGGEGIDSAQHSDTIRTECPEEFRQSLQQYFGEAFEKELAAMIPPATLDLRVNTFLISRENAHASLKQDGVETDHTPYSPWGLRAQDKAYLAKTKALKKGWISIQDEGSQLIALMCDAQPGMQVLDFCAGAGGKTLALGAAMKRKGRIVAMDNDEKRLGKGRERFKKAQLADIIEVRPLTEKRHTKWLRRQKETFDVTLCDVPCTGTGTWRRNPDMRWRTYGPSLDDLIAVQQEILERVADTVKPGGRLVYATCSLLPDENEKQVDAFLKNHPEYEVLPVDPEAGIGSPYMRLTPHRHNTDGFFAAILTKKKSNAPQRNC